MPTKKYRVSPDTVLVKIDEIKVPSWARSIERSYLEESIRSRGVLAPIIVAKIRKQKGVDLVLIDGAGRLELAKQQGLEEIPARLVEVKDENEALLLSIELEQTKEPWSLEYTLSVIQELLDRGFKKTEIAEILKVPRSKIYRLLYIAEMPEDLKYMFLNNIIPLRYAEKIYQLLQKYFDYDVLMALDMAQKPELSWEEIIERAEAILREEEEEEEKEKEEEIKEEEKKEEIPEIPLKVREEPAELEVSVSKEVLGIPEIKPPPVREEEGKEEFPGLEEAREIKEATRFVSMVKPRYFKCDPWTGGDVNLLDSLVKRAHYVITQLMKLEGWSSEITEDFLYIKDALEEIINTIDEWEWEIVTE